MVIFSIKKLEKRVREKAITPKQFIIYSFFVFGPFFSLFKINSSSIDRVAYDMLFVLSFIPIIISIAKYLCCYIIIKDKNIFLYLYLIIPVNFILGLRYFLLLMIPLIIINFILLRYCDLDSDFWNAISFQIIAIITQTASAINLVVIMQKFYKEMT